MASMSSKSPSEAEYGEPPPPYSSPTESIPFSFAATFPSRPQVLSTQAYSNCGTTTVVISSPCGVRSQVQPLIAAMQAFGPFPQRISCPKCTATVVTQTVPNPGLLSWILSGTLVLIGCIAGCCLIPCCVPECQDIEHRCPDCKSYLGIYRRV